MSSEAIDIRLGDCVDLITGYPFKSADYSDNPTDVRLLRGDNIGQGQLRWDGVKRWPVNKIGSDLTNYQLAKSDVLLAMDRPWIPAGLKFARALDGDLPALLVQRVACLRPRGAIRADFLYYILGSSQFSDYIQNVTTGTAVPHISAKQIKEFKFRLPSLPTQQQVGETLSALDDRITLLRETSATLAAMAHALFKSWFVDFDPVRGNQQGQIPEGMNEETAALFPDSFEESALGLVPKGWKIASLDEIANYLNGLALQKFPPEDDAWLPVIKIAQLRKGDTVGADRASRKLKAEYIVKDGDVLFSWSGSLEVEIWCGGEGALNQHLFKVTSDEYPKWFYYLWTKHHLANFRQIAASKATTMGHIQRKHLTDAKVVVPSPSVISEADSILGPLLNRIIATALKAQTLASIRDTLLPRLISGQLRITEVEDALESSEAP